MVITKEGVYELLEPCLGLTTGNFISVIKVGELSIRTTIHKYGINKSQPVSLIKEYVDEV